MSLNKSYNVNNIKFHKSIYFCLTMIHSFRHFWSHLILLEWSLYDLVAFCFIDVNAFRVHEVKDWISFWIFSYNKETCCESDVRNQCAVEYFYPSNHANSQSQLFFVENYSDNGEGSLLYTKSSSYWGHSTFYCMPARLGIQNEHNNILQQTAASDSILTLFNDDVTFDEFVWRRMGLECECKLILKFTVTQFKILLVFQH